MTNIPLLNVLIVLGALALIVAVTLALFRKFSRAPSRRAVFEDGGALSDAGLEYLGMFWIKCLIPYSNIDTVQVVPLWRAFLSSCGLGATCAYTRVTGHVVLVRVKDPHQLRAFAAPNYLVLTPKDPAAFAEQLQQRVRAQQTNS